MMYTNFGHLSQVQKLAVVLGAEYEASYEGKWIPAYRIIASNETKFRIAPKDAVLEREAQAILDARSK